MKKVAVLFFTSLLLGVMFLPAVLRAQRAQKSSGVHSVVAPVTSHPRLWLRVEDLSRLRSWAVASNPIYNNGLAVLADQAKNDMDAGRVPNQDAGATTYVDYPSEMYAELFAFMSLISSDSVTRQDYAQRARTLLMHVINIADLGAADTMPFRDPEFSTNDRSRWHGEGFPLTVDWIYPYLTTTDKAAIRRVFLRWVNENLHAAITAHDHPEPVGVVNNPILIQDTTQLRWAANNYFTAHMRNIGLMAMALDSADDPGDTLRNYLGNATGAWLYIIDYVMRSFCPGGLFPEGFEYAPQTVGYVAQFLLALHTAGHDLPSLWGPQVVFSGNPFWDEFVTATLHSFSPATVMQTDIGEVYQPAWYGDGLTYSAPDFVGAFGPLGLYDSQTGNTVRLAALRWIETNMAPGGAGNLTARARDGNFFQNAILYFMLFDPTAAPAPDPRPSLPLSWYARGLGRILARTSWDADAAWFTYKLSWNSVDHQYGDGNQFEFYRHGEWLTKERTGYDLDYGAAENHNTLALQNDAPLNNEPGTYRNINWLRGSQWAYVSSGNPQVIAYSLAKDYVYVMGDATALYNSVSENSTDIAHASRSLVWLKPDHIVIYDRATSKTANRFKRFWLNFPTQAVVSGTRATMTTASGQKLFVSTLLPVNATITSEPDTVVAGNVANFEPMNFRLRVEAPGGPQTVRFLHVLQGADAGANPNPVALVQSSSGVPFVGAQVANTVIMFPVDVGLPPAGFTYTASLATTTHVLTGLAPKGGYTVAMQNVSGNLQVTITSGGTSYADSGGVLVFRLPTVVERLDDIPTGYELRQNYPNPFNPSTTIEFALPQSGFVTLKVYDLLGREVTTLVNEWKKAGTYSVTFDLRHSSFELLSSGVYCYRLQSGQFLQTKKFVYLR